MMQGQGVIFFWKGGAPMSKFAGKKLLLLGERDGVPGPAMEEVFKNLNDAEVIFSVTECFV
jgi:betaine reductase